MNRTLTAASYITAASLALALTATHTRAEACGACFGPSMSQQVVTDHRMVLAVHANESILWDQFQYQGDPGDFAWVLPVSGDVTIELASGAFIDRLDAATAVNVQAPYVNLSCGTSNTFGFGGAASAPTAAEDATHRSVEVVNMSVVGPYQTVTLRSTDGDAGALTTWLRSNNYSIPAPLEPVIASYVAMHMDFLALRLRPGEGVQAMQPVRVRYANSSMVLPLRMIAAGISDKVGLKLWIFGNGRYEAANFANGTVDPEQVVWNWDTSSANYAELFKTTQNSLANGRAWITEYANQSNSLMYQAGFYQNQPAPTDGSPDPYIDWQLATQNSATGSWTTRLRTELLARFLDADLVVRASVGDTAVNNTIQATHEAGRRPGPNCPPDALPGHGAACSATPAIPASGAMGAVGAALAVLGLAAARMRRSRDEV